MATRASSDKDLRAALLEAAAHLIATEGAAALTLRRVAEDVGTSTMAIYTHFGGMPELRRAVRWEWLTRLAAQLAEVDETDDPVADLALRGVAYYARAVRDTDLYRVTFMEQPLDEADAAVGAKTVESLVESVQRCIDAGRFEAATASDLATEFWALGHGVIALQLARLISEEHAIHTLDAGLLKLFRAWGDEPDAARESLARARRRAGRE
jgi:AcrR family transcriptional regulator